MKKNFFLLAAMFITTLGAFAQMGTIRGTVIDDLTGETLIGVNVVIGGTMTGASTDLDGQFSIRVAEGTYNVEATYISFAKLTVSGVVVKADEVTVVGEMRLMPDAIQAGEVVITATRSRNNESAMATMQKKSANVMDGISSQTFKKVGDGDAGAAIKRVTGVTVEGGKYVFVRGLGDRYTKTTLNGMEIPGLDPDRNSIQLDIFPTNLIDNLSVFKTFTPDLSGDFTGGSVDIITKDFADDKESSFSASLGFSPAMNMNSDFVSYESTGADYVAFGNDPREIPIDRAIDLTALQFQDRAELADLTRQFDPVMGIDRKTSLLNTSLGYSTANQFKKGDYTIGYNVALNYSLNYKYYDDFIVSEYATSADSNQTDLQLSRKDSSEVGIEEVFWSAFATTSIKKQNSSLSLSLMHLQNAVKQSSLTDGITTGFPEGQPLVLRKQVLYYNQRSISSALLTFKQYMPEKNLELTFKTAPTLALNKEPDFRQTVFSIDDQLATIKVGNGGLANRIYRSLQEVSLGNRLDVKYNFNQWNGEKSVFRAGAAYTYKKREFDIFTYKILDEKSNYPGLDPNDILLDDNIYNPSTGDGARVEGSEQLNNIYTSSSNNFAAYAMVELPITNIFKVIGGVRLEQFTINYTGQRQVVNTSDDIFDDERVLDELNILPSIGAVYTVAEDMNVRVNFSQTVARPSFKEKSAAEIVDALTGRTFIGNLALEQTNISNYDIRWEKYFTGGQLVSASVFYKDLTNPIELVAFDQTAVDQFTPRNSSRAQLFGFELDAKKNLGFISESLKQYSLGANFTYVYSQLDRRDIFAPGVDGILGTADDVSEYQERVENKRAGEKVDKFRQLQGQSPYVINAYVNYRNDSLGLDVNVSYNVQGKRLSVVGIARNPNVFEQEFHSLNLKVAKSLGKDDKMSISLSAENILNDKREQFYESYKADDQVYSSFTPNRVFVVGFGYKF